MKRENRKDANGMRERDYANDGDFPHFSRWELIAAVAAGVGAAVVAALVVHLVASISAGTV